jgi:hypothetical protein
MINILLTILGYIPGHIHAFWLIYKKMKAEEQYGLNGFVYVGNGKYEAAPGAQIQQPPPNVSKSRERIEVIFPADCSPLKNPQYGSVS